MRITTMNNQHVSVHKEVTKYCLGAGYPEAWITIELVHDVDWDTYLFAFKMFFNDVIYIAYTANFMKMRSDLVKRLQKMLQEKDKNIIFINRNFTREHWTKYENWASKTISQLCGKKHLREISAKVIRQRGL